MDEGPGAIKLRQRVRAGLVLAMMCTGLGRSDTNVQPGPKVLRLDVDGVTFELVRIPAGRFLMGSENGDSDERPVHEVSIADDFYMGRTEVTVRQFRAFVESTGYQTVAQRQGAAWHIPSPDNRKWTRGCNWRSPPFEQRDDHPVVCLSYVDAGAFCAWLSARSGQPIRLPTEAQWEYACRAGTTGDHAGGLGEMGWYAWNSAGRTHPVARKKPNAWGLYDMHGNAWEWVQDMYHRDGPEAPTDGSAWRATPEVDPRGITRGGSFYNPEWLCRSYIRMQTPLGHVVHYNNGLRLVCDVTELRN